MDKKIFFFRPATLRKAADRWQIVYAVEDPSLQGVYIRKRVTFDINRIKNLRAREISARKWVNRLNSKLLPNGYPFRSIAEIEEPGLSLLKEFTFAVKIKQVSDKVETVRTYRGVESIFKQFLEHENLKMLPLEMFSKKHVTAFSDYITVTRSNSPRTHNNYLGFLHAIWEELVSREKVQVNPWRKAKRLKAAPTERRAFSPAERKVVADHIYKNDKYLFLWISLEYYCFIRGAELRRLKLNMINLKEGYIYLPANCTKNGKARNITIPKSLEADLLDVVSVWPNDWLLFGAKFKPHARKAVGKNTPNLRHRNILLKLLKEGNLYDIKGLSIYCWKYTGISDDVNENYVSITDVQGQADHADTAQTIKYLRRKKVNERIRHSKKDIFR